MRPQALRTAAGALIPALAEAPALTAEQVAEHFERLRQLPPAGGPHGALPPDLALGESRNGASERGAAAGAGSEAPPVTAQGPGLRKRACLGAAAAAAHTMQPLPVDDFADGARSTLPLGMQVRSTAWPYKIVPIPLRLPETHPAAQACWSSWRPTLPRARRPCSASAGARSAMPPLGSRRRRHHLPGKPKLCCSRYHGGLTCAPLLLSVLSLLVSHKQMCCLFCALSPMISMQFRKLVNVR